MMNPILINTYEVILVKYYPKSIAGQKNGLVNLHLKLSSEIK